MYCRYNYNPNCKDCRNFVKTEKVSGNAKELILTIPERCLCNSCAVCICIAQPIPAEVGKDSNVKIKVGDNEYNTITPCGNFIYSDQVCCNKMYCFKFASDSKLFTYKGGWRLARTKHAFDCIPIKTSCPPYFFEVDKKPTPTQTNKK